MTTILKDAAKFVCEFAKTEKFKQFIKAELIVLAIMLTTIFGIRTYVDYVDAKAYEAVYKNIDRETVRRGVNYLIQEVDKYIEEQQAAEQL